MRKDERIKIYVTQAEKYIMFKINISISTYLTITTHMTYIKN